MNFRSGSKISKYSEPPMSTRVIRDQTVSEK
jgi:hypothetical protein